ncbi:MAG: DEAD/DEAH box helicase family protein, partial [Bacteroidota bacterium]
EISDETEDAVLEDNNLQAIKDSPEFMSNKSPNTPTNRILTSLISRQRLEFLFRYGFAYVQREKGVQKHIMRYPQLFATRAIGRKLDQGIRKGIIWHTQGSGKTALAYFNVKFLMEYFLRWNRRDDPKLASAKTIPKFYFIVDRIDLLEQASKEFKARGLEVHHVSSREAFFEDIRSHQATHNAAGKDEITVVNIQKFSNDTTAIQQADYAIDIQRIYFLDEVHRSYNPKGSFLANLERSDPSAIKIGLTGTPLLAKDYKSKDLFGDYIHKYYYNASIADGYTLRLMREEISTQYRAKVASVISELEIEKGAISKRDLYAHPKFVRPMLRYIVEDFERSRSNAGPLSADVGAMIVCDSSEQARELYQQFNLFIDTQRMQLPNGPRNLQESLPFDRLEDTDSKAALILHDEGSKSFRKDKVDEFKAGKIDYLFVYNMLLTGFDAPRLKKLYLTRVIKRHNLLQALTRVNRTYKKERYGYVVDFADISSEFEATNRDYLEELQEELGDEMEHYSKLFKSKEEIGQEIEAIKDFLWTFETKNNEAFSRELDEITDLDTMRSIARVLTSARELHNIIRLKGEDELLEKIDFHRLKTLSLLANSRLNALREREALDNAQDNTNLLNLALEDIVFLFEKVGQEELRLADELRNKLRRTREALQNNFDKKDPEYISLYEELERLFREQGLDKTDQAALIANNRALDRLYKGVRELNRRNDQMRNQYRNDPKAARVHKRIQERGQLDLSDRQLGAALMALKQEIDDRLLRKRDLLNNQAFFLQAMQRMVIEQFFKAQNIPLSTTAVSDISQLISTEYLQEFRS